ncbi:capsular polysaccharide export protein [Gammaproteobacteria bacterium]
MKRIFLFLQGPIGPCFRLLAERLQAEGHVVTKINIWGGDIVDFPNGICYRGKAEDWSNWIIEEAMRRGTTDLVLFGDQRPAHREAIAVLKDKLERIHVLEEGYFRPDWVTLDRGGGKFR